MACPSRGIYPVMLLAITSLSTGGILDGLIPLTCEQIQAVNTAIENGTVANINRTLDAEGTIFVGDSRFPQIVVPTPEQERVLQSCYSPSALPPAPVPDLEQQGGSLRRKRNVPGFLVDEACYGGVSSVLMVRTMAGGTAQVMINDIGSAGSCQKTLGSRCGGDCCKTDFDVTAVITEYRMGVSNMELATIVVEHCTCV